MNTYEVFTDKNSVIVQSESILKALEKVEGTVLAIMEVGFRDEELGSVKNDGELKPSDLVPLPSTWLNGEFKKAWDRDHEGSHLTDKERKEHWREIERTAHIFYQWQVKAKIEQISKMRQPVTQSSELLEALKEVADKIANHRVKHFETEAELYEVEVDVYKIMDKIESKTKI